MMEKKIGIVLYTEPYMGGEHQYALIMAECLMKLVKAQYEIIAIIGNQFWMDWCDNNNVRYILNKHYRSNRIMIACNLYFPLFSRLYNKYLTKLGRTVEKEKIDILLYTNQLVFIPNLGTKIITPVHDLMHRYEPSFPEIQKSYIGRELRFKCQAKYADYILTDSELGKLQFKESYLKSGRSKWDGILRISVLPFIVPDHIYEVKEEYVEVPDKYVFYPAQFWKHKNHINLVKAIQLLKKNIGDIHLILVGSEKGCRMEIEQYISSNGLEKNISILGFVNNENITYLYMHAVGMIMPSYFGPTNIPPLEAMALGCPVAVSNKYAMPEQVGDAGLTFNPDSPEEIADCIKRLWTDNNLREEMVKKGYKKISEWTKEDFENRVYKIIDDCLLY